jgi:hypothetical protein
MTAWLCAAIKPQRVWQSSTGRMAQNRARAVPSRSPRYLFNSIELNTENTVDGSSASRLTTTLCG